MAKYKLKEGKSLEGFPQAGGIGRSIYNALVSCGEYVDFPGAQEIPSDCLKHLSKEEDKKPIASAPKESSKPKKGGSK